MTVSSTTRKAGPYAGNASGTSFSFAFKVFQASDVLVVRSDGTTETVLVLTTDYTVSLNADQNANPGGTVIYPATGLPLPVGQTLTLSSSLPETQGTSIANQGGFYPKIIEDAFDRLTILVQQLRQAISRTMTFPLSDSAPVTTLPPAASRANKVLAFDTNGDPIASTTDAANVTAAQAFADAAAASANQAAGSVAAAGLPGSLTGKALQMLRVLAGETGYEHRTPGQVRTDIGAASSGVNSDITSVVFLPTVNDFRLSLSTGVAVTTSDVTSATSIRAVPYRGNRIALYDGANWNLRSSAEFSLALGTLVSGRPYDVFAYDNVGVPTLEFLAWTNDTSRATALTYQDGVLVKSGAVTRRYLGTFYTTGTTTTEDSLANRYLFNYYNRVRRSMRRFEAAASWTYSTSTWRQANGSTANQLNFVLGVSEDAVDAEATVSFASSSVNAAYISIGLDNATPISVKPTQSVGTSVLSNNVPHTVIVSAGKHSLTWLEYAAGAGTLTWYGANGEIQSGMVGSLMA